MYIVLKQQHNRVRNGFFASSPQLKLSAAGHTAAAASQNLERVALLFLRPFERQGTLEAELKQACVTYQENGPELVVVTADYRWPHVLAKDSRAGLLELANA